MKVTCEGCNASFKVKGEVAPGKAFKFKCPKCGITNRLKSEEEGVLVPKPKVQCEDCGTSIFEPPEGDPRLCDQCRASRAVKEAQKLRTQAEESPLPEGVEFPDELFNPEEEERMPEEIPEPAEPPETPEPPEPVAAKEPSSISEALKELPEPEPEPEPAPEPAPEPESAPAPESLKEIPEEEAAPDLHGTAREETLEKEFPPTPAEKAAPSGEKIEDEEEEEEEVIIGAPPQKPATPDSTYRVRSSDGLIIGPIKLKTLRDLIMARKVHSDEEFSRDDGSWMSMADFPELFEIFQSETVAKAREEEEEIVAEDLSRVKMSKDKILSLLKVKRKCVGCGEEIFVIEDIPNPLCDQCRIEALVTKKKKVSETGGEVLYRIRTPDGLVLGPLRRSTVEDLVAAKNIRGVEEISIGNGPWHSIIEVEEFSEMFEAPIEDVIDLTETADG